MAKILNRAILLSGERRKVGTPVVTIFSLDKSSMVTRASGATVPTDADAGYAAGCIFTLTSGASVGATVYINEGSATSADFNAVTSGAAGGVSNFDQLYANDKTLAVTGTTVTFDGQHASNNVFTLTSTGAGTGHLLQITNVGTGKDINGTNDTWSVSKTGDAVFNKVTFAGDADSTGFTLTAGDFVLSDGSMALTNADDEATLTVTNNTATTASVVVYAGSGAFTGSTTTSFMTITPSGLTTGTAVYLPVAALTTGKAIHVVANAATSGKVVNITSSATAITGAGRLLHVDHSGATGGTAILSEFSSAANDETVILKVTASDALAAGVALQVSAAALTTGKAISAGDLDLMTSGIGLDLVSAATAITGAGRMLFVNHTGATSSTGIIAEFKTAATDTTNLVKITTAAMIDGVGLLVAGTTGMTTGSLIKVTTSTAGAVATNGIVSIKGTGAHTSTSNVGLLDVQSSAAIGAATIVNIKSTAASQTAVNLLNVEQSGATLTAYTGSIVRLVAGFSGSSSTGNAIGVTAVHTTAGDAMLITNNALTLGAATLINLVHGTSVLGAGTSMLRITSTGIDTGTTTGTLLDLAATAATAAHLVIITSASLTTGTAMKFTLNGLTTGSGINVASDSSDTGTRVLVQITNDNTAATGAVCLSLKNDSTAGAAMSITGTGVLGIDFSALGVADSIFKATFTTDATMKAPQTVAADGFVKIDVGGVAHYIPCYTVA